MKYIHILKDLIDNFYVTTYSRDFTLKSNTYGYDKVIDGDAKIVCGRGRVLKDEWLNPDFYKFGPNHIQTDKTFHKKDVVFISIITIILSHKSINFLKRIKNGIVVHRYISRNINLITNILAIQEQLTIVSIFNVNLSCVIKVFIHNYFHLATSVKISRAMSHML